MKCFTSVFNSYLILFRVWDVKIPSLCVVEGSLVFLLAFYHQKGGMVHPINRSFSEKRIASSKITLLPKRKQSLFDIIVSYLLLTFVFPFCRDFKAFHVEWEFGFVSYMLKQTNYFYNFKVYRLQLIVHLHALSRWNKF